MYSICYSKSSVIDNKSEFDEFETLEEFIVWLRSFEGAYRTLVLSYVKDKKGVK